MKLKEMDGKLLLLHFLHLRDRKVNDFSLGNNMQFMKEITECYDELLDRLEK